MKVHATQVGTASRNASESHDRASDDHLPAQQRHPQVTPPTPSIVPCGKYGLESSQIQSVTVALTADFVASATRYFNLTNNARTSRDREVGAAVAALEIGAYLVPALRVGLRRLHRWMQQNA
jgi:hypothetical protein